MILDPGLHFEIILWYSGERELVRTVWHASGWAGTRWILL